jgi:AP-3 complex subunit mu
MMDNGFPLTTEPNVLKEMIPPPTILKKVMDSVSGPKYVADFPLFPSSPSTHSYFSHLLSTHCYFIIFFFFHRGNSALPKGTLSNVPWRKAGAKYNSNEIFLDIIEEIDVIVDSSGHAVSFEVQGEIQCNCRLSGKRSSTYLPSSFLFGAEVEGRAVGFAFLPCRN